MHESHDASGRQARVHLELEPTDRASATSPALCLVYEDQRVELPWPLVVAVFERYGKEQAPEIRPAPDAVRLDLGEGRALVHLRHLARFDVIARDFVVLERPDRPPLVELCTAIGAALVHLAEATS